MRFVSLPSEKAISLLSDSRMASAYFLNVGIQSGRVNGIQAIFLGMYLSVLCYATLTRRSLLFCEMQLHLTATHILVQPLPYRLNALAQADELSGGSAILLLPHGIPAFYIQPHNVDDATVSEFSESLSQNGITQTVPKDFARCYVPFRRVNDHQDGGITTIWPRGLILATPARPSLPTFSNAVPTALHSQQRPMPTMTIASSLTSLSLQPAVSLAALSSAMGAFVDAAMKERERPKLEPSRNFPAPQPNPASQAEPMLETPAAPDAPPTTMSAPLPPRSGPAQSYPSPLEMTVSRTEPAPVSAAAENPPSNPISEPPVPAAQPEEISSTQPAEYPNSSQTAALNPWESIGFSDFGFGSRGGMSSDPFAFTEADFTFFDVPAAHSSSADLGTQNAANGNTALPDVMLALSGQTDDFGKLDTSLMDWSMSETAPFSVVGETAGTAAHEVFSAADFDLASFPNDPQLMSLLEKPQALPEITLDGDSAAVPVQEDQRMTGETPRAEEEEEEESSSGFSALRFGKDHDLADDKYFNGKYSLPSPPPERKVTKSSKPIYAALSVKDDSTKYSKAVGLLSSPLKSSTAREGDLRARYMAATHPSRAMLYKLAGTKRFWDMAALGPSTGNNSPVEESASASPSKKRRLTWSSTNEAWRNPTPPAEESEDDDDEDGDSSMGGNDEWNDEADTPMDGVEPISPTGPYKSDVTQQQQQRHESPIKLLQTRFDRNWIMDHDLAAPMDISLPTASTTSSLLSPYRSNAPLVPMSVPTPVSPEAQPSANEGPMRLATNLAQRFAREAARNPLWNAVVVAMRELGPLGSQTRRELWQAEVSVVLNALQRSKRTEWGKSIAEITESEDGKFEPR